MHERFFGKGEFLRKSEGERGRQKGRKVTQCSTYFNDSESGNVSVELLLKLDIIRCVFTFVYIANVNCKLTKVLKTSCDKDGA